MIANVVGKYVGCRSGETSKARVKFVDLFFNLFDKNGVPDIEQVKIRSYEPKVFEECLSLKSGDDVVIELSIQNAVVKSIFADN